MTRKHYLPEGLPAPAPYNDGLAEEYWKANRRHELVVQRCTKCKTWQWGPDYICYNCHSSELTYEQVAKTGVIYSWERCWYPVHPALRDGVPYIVVLVELPQAGNVRMVGNLVGDPEQKVVIGSKVEAVFEDHDDDPNAEDHFTLVHWKVVS